MRIARLGELGLRRVDSDRASDLRPPSGTIDLSMNSGSWKGSSNWHLHAALLARLEEQQVPAGTRPGMKARSSGPAPSCSSAAAIFCAAIGSLSAGKRGRLRSGASIMWPLNSSTCRGCQLSSGFAQLLQRAVERRDARVDVRPAGNRAPSAAATARGRS